MPNSLLQLQGDYASGSDEFVPVTPEKAFDEQDGQHDCSDFHTPAQISKRLLLPSVSPVKTRQVAISELDFDDVECFIIFPFDPDVLFVLI